MDFGSLDFNVGAEGMAKQDQKKKKNTSTTHGV